MPGQNNPNLNPPSTPNAPGNLTVITPSTGSAIVATNLTARQPGMAGQPGNQQTYVPNNPPRVPFATSPPGQPWMTTARPPVFTNRPPVFTNRPPVFTNRPPVFTNRPPVFTNQPAR